MTSSLETVALRKEYPGTVALKDVSLLFQGGCIHALIGKNGAGKSTLVKIFAGATQPTSGSILLNGESIRLRSPREAFDRGIATVHQELSLVPGLSVAENILLGRLPRLRRWHGLVDWPEAYRRASEILSGLGINLDVRMDAGRLGIAQQQAVEIAKAVSYNPAVLMLDEPTSALAQRETDRLFDVLRQLAARGVVLLYISHRLQELPRIADKVSVLRDGELTGTVNISDATPETLAHMMFGQTAPTTRPSDLRHGEKEVMRVRSLSRQAGFSNVSFALHEGEILGIAGLLGSGRTELLRALFGADQAESGTVDIDGVSVRPHDPRQMKRLGIALTPENRKEEGLVQIASTRMNMCLANLSGVASHGFLSRRSERAVARKFINELDIRVPDLESPVSRLSGGNQQKVVAGKWLSTGPRVLLFDEPTRGIDVQAKQQMFRIMWDLSRRGVSAIFVSSELEELLAVCHRILIMRSGTITGEVRPGDVTVEQLFTLCMHD